MIQITQEDNIFDILEKIKKSSDKKIVLSFSLGHPVLYNKFLLQTIKDFDKNKKITIKTNDLASKKLIKKVWLKIKTEQDNKLLKINYSFLEYLKYELNKLKNKFFKNKYKNDPRNKFLKYYKQKSNIHIFMFLLLISIIIFSYVFFFILNKTFVYITPNIEVREKNLNFVFTEKQDSLSNQKTIQVKKIKKQTNLEKIISTTWIKQLDRHKAHWEIVIINKFPKEIRLLKNTRLESPNGSLYEIRESVTIPKATTNKLNTLIPGRKKVEIIAKTTNIKWDFSWEKANLPKNIFLKFPWLSKEDQKQLFAQTTTDIKWWKDIYYRYLTQKDIDDATKILKEELKKKAIKEIRGKVEKENTQNNTNYKIIDIKDIYEFSDLKIDDIKYKVWDKINSFPIKWSINIQSFVFDTSKVLSILRNEIYQHILKNKEELISIDENSLSILPKVWIIHRNKNPFYVKLTIWVNYYVKYNFNEKTKTYINRLKQEIAWLDKDKATLKLINEDRISDVSIEIRPFFIHTVSKYLDNIIFKIKNP